MKLKISKQKMMLAKKTGSEFKQPQSKMWNVKDLNKILKQKKDRTTLRTKRKGERKRGQRLILTTRKRPKGQLSQNDYFIIFVILYGVSKDRRSGQDRATI